MTREMACTAALIAGTAVILNGLILCWLHTR